jgi:O-antigen/teichoic acid export membrane protein
MISLSRNLFKNAFFQYLDLLLDIGAMLILTPFILNILGKKNFGAWSFVWSFVHIFQIFNAALGISIVKYLSQALEKKEIERQKQVLSTLFWLYTTLGFFIFILVSIITQSFPFLFPSIHSKVLDISSIFFLLGLAVSIQLPLSTFDGILIGYHKYYIVSSCRILSTSFYFFSVLFFLQAQPSLLTLASIFLIRIPLASTLMLFYVFFFIPHFSLRWKYIEKSLYRQALSLSSSISMIKIIYYAEKHFDTFLIAFFLKLEYVTYFSIANRICTYATLFSNRISLLITPQYAELHSAGDHQRIVTLLFRSTKFTLAFATPLVWGIFFFADPLIHTWTKRLDMQTSVPLCQLLALHCFISLYLFDVFILMLISNQQRFMLKIVAGSYGVNLSFTLLLLWWIGIQGVVIGTFIGGILSQTVHLRASSLYSYSLWNFYKEVSRPNLLSFLSFSTYALLVSHFYSFTRLWQVALAEIFGCLLYWSLFWKIGLSSEELLFLQKKIKKRLNPQKKKTEDALEEFPP